MPGIGHTSAEGSRPPPYRWGSRVLCRLSKKVCSPLGPLCEGAPPAGGGGENCAVARNILGYGKVLSLRFDTLGNGLDRSGDVCRCCMVKYCCGVGAAYMRPGSVRQTGAYGKPAGRACPAPTARRTKKRTPMQPSRRGSAAESLPLTPSPQTPLLPPSRRSPPFLPYRRC